MLFPVKPKGDQVAMITVHAGSYQFTNLLGNDMGACGDIQQKLPKENYRSALLHRLEPRAINSFPALVVNCSAGDYFALKTCHVSVLSFNKGSLPDRTQSN